MSVFVATLFQANHWPSAETVGVHSSEAAAVQTVLRCAFRSLDVGDYDPSQRFYLGENYLRDFGNPDSPAEVWKDRWNASSGIGHFSVEEWALGQDGSGVMVRRSVCQFDALAKSLIADKSHQDTLALLASWRRQVEAGICPADLAGVMLVADRWPRARVPADRREWVERHGAGTDPLQDDVSVQGE